MNEVVGLLALASLAAAALAALLSRASGAAALLLAAAAAWVVGPAVPALVFVHRPLLLHALLLTHVSRRLDRWSLALLAATWASALVVPIGRIPAVMLGLALLVGAEAARRQRQAVSTHRHLPTPPVTGMVALALALGVPAVLRLSGLLSAWPSLPALLYEALIASTGVAVTGAFSRQTWRAGADVVLELADAAPRATVEALRQEAAQGQAAGASLLAAADLLDSHVRLSDDLAARADDVRASRLRLINAAVDERRRLALVLSDGPGRCLADLGRTLDDLADHLAAPPGTEAAQELVQSCRAEVVRTEEDLDQLVRGLHPRLLVEQGLRAALLDLSGRCPVPVDCCIPERRLTDRVEIALWYAVAEAVTNAGKHAGATRITVTVRPERGQVVATVSDDGSGGAVVEPGGGLAGLADRLDALGGHLEVCSPAGVGTELRMTVPT